MLNIGGVFMGSFVSNIMLASASILDKWLTLLEAKME